MLKGKKLLFVLTMMTGFCLLAGCGKNNKDGKTVIELVQYKPEATSYFEEVEERFNASHDDIELKISSPNKFFPLLIVPAKFITDSFLDGVITISRSALTEKRSFGCSKPELPVMR